MSQGRGRGGVGRGNYKEDSYRFSPERFTLAQRVNNNRQKFDDEDDESIKEDDDRQIQEAIEKSKRTAEEEQYKREAGLPLDEEIGVQTAPQVPDSSGWDVAVSDDEDDSQKGVTAKKGGKIRFVTSEGTSSKTATANRCGGKSQGGNARSKMKEKDTDPDYRPPGSKLMQKTTLPGYFPVDDSGDKSALPPKGNRTATSSGTSTKQKTTKSFAEAVSGRSDTNLITQQLKRTAVSEKPFTNVTEKVEIPAGHRCNPFTNQIEPVSKYKPLPIVTKPPTNTWRVRTPHDFHVGNDGLPLTTPTKKARAFSDYVEEMNREAHRRQKALASLPAHFVCYRIGEYLGTKGRSLPTVAELSGVGDGFSGCLTEEQRLWVKERRHYLKELETEKERDTVTMKEGSSG